MKYEINTSPEQAPRMPGVSQEVFQASLLGPEPDVLPYTVNALNNTLKGLEAFSSMTGMAIPTIDQFIRDGLSLETLSTAYDELEIDGVKPEVIIAPDFSGTTWKNIFSKITSIPTLYIDDDVTDTIFRVSHANMGPRTTKTYTEVEERVWWSMRIVGLQQDRADSTVFPKERSVKQSFMTIGEFLTSQAVHLITHNEVRETRSTWTNMRVDDLKAVSVSSNRIQDTIVITPGYNSVRRLVNRTHSDLGAKR